MPNTLCLRGQIAILEAIQMDARLFVPVHADNAVLFIQDTEDINSITEWYLAPLASAGIISIRIVAGVANNMHSLAALSNDDAT